MGIPSDPNRSDVTDDLPQIMPLDPRKLQQKVSVLEGENEELRRRVQTLEGDCRSLQTYEGECEPLRKVVETLMCRISSLEAQIAPAQQTPAQPMPTQSAPLAARLNGSTGTSPCTSPRLLVQRGRKVPA